MHMDAMHKCDPSQFPSSVYSSYGVKGTLKRLLNCKPFKPNVVTRIYVVTRGSHICLYAVLLVSQIFGNLPKICY